MKMCGAIFLSVVVGGVLLNGCGSSSTKNTTAYEFSDQMNAPQNWQMQMQALEKTMVELYPYALDPSEFDNKKNEKYIRDSLQRLSATAKNVNHSPMTTMNDPTLSFISFDFRQQMGDIERAFADNKKSYARFELLKATQYCVECHTQSNKGPSFGHSQFQAKVKSLPLLDQAEMFVATRRFDEALKIYIDFFKQTNVSWDEQFKSERAIHNALSILIRYKRDPQAALKFLEQLEKASFLPLYLKNMVLVWKGDVQTWSKEMKSQKATLTHVKVWIERSNARTFEYGKLGSEIWNQLSVSYLHEFLDNTKFEKLKADILWMLGTSYINGLNPYQSQLGEKYLEACIRTFPNSVHANRCYSKLEGYVYDTNTGSAGTFMSIEEERRLKELKKMAEPK